MNRADRRRYKGRKPRSGLTAEQVGLVVLITLAAILFMTMKVNSYWCGKSCGEQLYDALFVTEDWS